jgi:hypothetical protein
VISSASASLDLATSEWLRSSSVSPASISHVSLLDALALSREIPLAASAAALIEAASEDSASGTLLVTPSAVGQLSLLAEALLLGFSSVAVCVGFVPGVGVESDADGVATAMASALAAAESFRAAASAIEAKGGRSLDGLSMADSSPPWGPGAASLYAAEDGSSAELLAMYAALPAACAGLLESIGALASPRLMEGGSPPPEAASSSAAVVRAGEAVREATRVCSVFFPSHSSPPLVQASWCERSSSLRQAPLAPLSRTQALMRIAIDPAQWSSEVRGGLATAVADAWPAALAQLLPVPAAPEAVADPSAARGPIGTWARMLTQEASATRAAISLAASAGAAREVQAELAAQLAARDRDLVEMRARVRGLESSAATAAIGGRVTITEAEKASERPEPVANTAASPAIAAAPLPSLILQAALRYSRDECASLRARLGDFNHSPALSWLLQNPLPAVTSSHPVAQSPEQERSLKGLLTALDSASEALSSVQMARVRRRVPMLNLRRGRPEFEDRNGGSPVADQILADACGAAALLPRLRGAADLLHEQQVHLQPKSG